MPLHTLLLSGTGDLFHLHWILFLALEPFLSVTLAAKPAVHLSEWESRDTRHDGGHRGRKPGPQSPLLPAPTTAIPLVPPPTSNGQRGKAQFSTVSLVWGVFEPNLTALSGQYTLGS
ncbi:hypothetical protein B0H13DRAFT_2325997 [Mycena leptocephala]|nr:hypothetical protein B0H13DRAFT_2325997 [Mycena leptocephala]